MPSRRSLHDLIEILMTWALTRNSAEVVRRWNDPNPPDLETVHDVVARFLETGSVLPVHRGTIERPVRTEDALEAVRESVDENPTLSVRHRSTLLRISYTTLDRMLHELQLRPYRMQRVHLLYDEDYRERFEKFLRIKNMLVEDETLIDRIWFSDECSFDLTKTVNTHNATYWSTTNPHFHVEHLNSGVSVNTFAAISSQGIIGPYFFSEKNSGPVYRGVLNGFLFPALRARANIETQYFMQDGASPHTALETRTLLNHTFPNRWIGMFGPIEWPARSPDMTPCDFFLWGHLFDKVYAHSPDTLDQLKDAITVEMGRIPIEICQNAVRSFAARVTVLLDRNGAHVEL
ncbi:putative Histone-lysine N-methyltransferase SETMAR [Blattamonas nauphoetae]|uniref:Histone-lysine N-methyltransferase SETMAR n=1 Tax=Blattamonas nauphoetae TaxID=2049346 RepID=A0ABQ9XL46_9EUKA|nr:putative Histone-lysine N-methyltransferase SETMAR [Blattamonas nauphoetae]